MIVAWQYLPWPFSCLISQHKKRIDIPNGVCIFTQIILLLYIHEEVFLFSICIVHSTAKLFKPYRMATRRSEWWLIMPIWLTWDIPVVGVTMIAASVISGIIVVLSFKGLLVDVDAQLTSPHVCADTCKYIISYACHLPQCCCDYTIYKYRNHFHW